MAERAPVRIGVVGCGMVAQAMHLQHLSQLQDRFELAAIADPSRTVREAVAARYGVHGVHENYGSLLQNDPDARGVAAPPPAHAEIAPAPPHPRVPVFWGKPLCIPLA